MKTEILRDVSISGIYYNKQALKLLTRYDGENVIPVTLEREP
jgi:hypothetical protein